MIAGMLLDIAVDPLTYIALDIIKKVPGITKGLKAIKEATFGKMVTKTIQETPELESAIGAGKRLLMQFRGKNISNSRRWDKNWQMAW